MCEQILLDKERLMVLRNVLKMRGRSSKWKNKPKLYDFPVQILAKDYTPIASGTLRLGSLSNCEKIGFLCTSAVLIKDEDYILKSTSNKMERRWFVKNEGISKRRVRLNDYRYKVHINRRKERKNNK